jgi:adenylyltransferase/sulfurtransferase
MTSITPKDLKAQIDETGPIRLLDVREPFESEICSIGGELIPKDTVLTNLERLPRDKEIVVYCRSGGRSQWIAEQLQRVGFEQLSNLAGGILRWSDEVDPGVRKY